MEFEWDPARDQANRARHGLSFEEAAALFASGVDYLEIFDGEHDSEEDRFIAIGPVRRGAIVVIYTERHEDTIRIIGARFATKAEVRLLRTNSEGAQ